MKSQSGMPSAKLPAKPPSTNVAKTVAPDAPPAVVVLRDASPHPIVVQPSSGVSLDWALVYILTAIAVAVIVHLLTARRDRRKATFDLHEALVTAVKSARDTALSRWDAKTQWKRQMLANRAATDLQRVGSIARKLGLESDHLGHRGRRRVNLTDHIAALRDAITTEEFQDPAQGGTPARRQGVEQACGIFIVEAELAITTWMS